MTATVIINVIHIVVSTMLAAVILLQVKGQGGGLFGAADNSFRTRRGLELQLFRFTIGLTVLFIALSILSAWQFTGRGPF